jgi:murein DD-endopeptidase MepM/ murein hydrolase activator NlpD
VAIAACALALAAPSGAGATARYDLLHAGVSPERAYFDGERPVSIRFRFEAARRVTVIVKAIRSKTGQVVRRWTRPGLAPGRRRRITWDGSQSGGGAAPPGRYTVRIARPGHRGIVAGRTEVRDHAFPVAGPHSYGDRFGEPRSGGRVHEGQDLPAPCGTPLVAARGGQVRARGYSDALYGHWVLIDGRATRRDYFYAHLVAPTPLGAGERVGTAERIGAVGKSGNARSEFCQLHFELWPLGYRRADPIDPLAELRRWDPGVH